MSKSGVEHDAAEHEHDQPDDDVAGSPRGGIDHRQEDEEEQQRGAQVALDDDDGQGNAPHRQHRQQERQWRQLEWTDACVGRDQQPAVLGEVAGQEYDQDDFQQLGRLATERADAQRQARAAHDIAKDKHEQQQADAGGCPRVLVPAQPTVAAHEHGHQAENGEADHQPDHLQRRQRQQRAAQALAVRSCGRRSISSRDRPPSSAAAGSSTWSMRRPLTTNATWTAATVAI